MGVIINRIKLVGSKGEKKVDALYDSGASFSFIQKELADKLDTVLAIPKPIAFETAKEGDELYVRERVVLDFYIEGIRFQMNF